MTKEIFLKDHHLEFTLDVDSVIRQCFEILQSKVAENTSDDKMGVHCNFGVSIRYSRLQDGYAIVASPYHDSYTYMVLDWSANDTPFNSEEYECAIADINESIAKYLRNRYLNNSYPSFIQTILSLSSQAEFTDPEEAYYVIQEVMDPYSVDDFFPTGLDELAEFEFDYKMCQQLVKVNPPILMNVDVGDDRIPLQPVLSDHYFDLTLRDWPANYVIEKMFEDETYYILTGVGGDFTDYFNFNSATTKARELKSMLSNYSHLFDVRLVPSPKDVVNRRRPEGYEDIIPVTFRPYSEEL